eukprot:scaffold1535_cov382-Prasinococcus_capsulatus_cf.AAC.45
MASSSMPAHMQEGSAPSPRGSEVALPADTSCSRKVLRGSRTAARAGRRSLRGSRCACSVRRRQGRASWEPAAPSSTSSLGCGHEGVSSSRRFVRG